MNTSLMLPGRILILLTVLSAMPRPAVPAPADYDCTRSGCHIAPSDTEFVHKLVQEGECTACHRPDASDGEFHPEWLGEPGGGCLSCHGDAFEPSRERESSSGNFESKSLAMKIRRHGAVAEGRCVDCHLLHGGSQRGLLRGVFPLSNYASYDRRVYSSCLASCHSPDLVETKETTTATLFRNGSDNLHFRHVVSPARGRSCHLCHTPHLARSRGLVRTSMPFGKDRLTLKFSAHETGGRCETSCHLAAEYDRELAIPSRMRIVEPHSNSENNP